MKFLFIDEIQLQQKNEKFFGVGGLIIDSALYSKFKCEFQECLKSINWRKDREFKGRYLFSQKGDKNVSVEKRIGFVKKIAELSIANKYARYSFTFSYNFKGKSESNYLLLLSKIIKKISSPAKRRADKCLIAVYYDSDKCLNPKTVHKVIEDNLKSKLVIFERPFYVDSDNNTCGILTVDILNYLKAWVELNDEKESQYTLFNFNLSDNNQRKLNTIKEIISKVKNNKVLN